MCLFTLVILNSGCVVQNAWSVTDGDMGGKGEKSLFQRKKLKPKCEQEDAHFSY